MSRKNFTVPFLKYQSFKLKFRVFLAGHGCTGDKKNFRRLRRTGLDFQDLMAMATVVLQ